MQDSVTDIEAKLAELPADAEHARERVDLLNELGWEVRGQQDFQRMLEVAQQAMDLSHKHSYQAGLVGSFRNSAFAHYMMASFKFALAEALVCFRMAEELDDKNNQANALSVIALVQWSLGNYDEALKEAFRGLRIVEAEKNYWAVAWAYTIIGGIYQSLRDYQQALQYHEKSHKIFAAQDYPLGEGRSLTGLGSVYQALGDLEAALECHEKSLQIYRSIENGIGEARALNDIGEIYQKRGDYDRALELHREALELRQKLGQRQAQVTSLLNLGSIYLTTGRRDEAREMLERAQSEAEAMGVKPKLYEAHELLSRLYQSTGELELALRHHKEFHRIKEDVFNEEESTKLRNLQIGIEVERSQQEAEIHRLKNVELKEKNNELAKVIKELHATQAELVQREKMAALGDIVAAIAHEINTPLGAIHTSADIAVRGARRVVEAIEASQTIEELKARRSLQATVAALQMNGKLIRDASARIAKLIESLKSFARLDQASFQEFDLTRSLEDTLTLLEPRLRDRVTVVKNYGELPKVFGYPAEINQVFMNLLRNAEEAIDEKGTITISTSADNGSVVIKVADTGRGIPPEQVSKLFNPGFRIQDARVKASMSLFTSLNIVQKHQGDIQVESEPGKGSVFTVRLARLRPSREKEKVGAT